MVDARILKLCLVGFVLVTATPAVASDFSGIGRAFNWLLLAAIFLITSSVILFRHRGKVFGIVPNVLLASCASVMFAPGIYFEQIGVPETAWNPLPGSLLAALEGSIEPLWPVSIFSMGAFFLIGFMLLQRRDRKNAEAGGEAL